MLRYGVATMVLLLAGCPTEPDERYCDGQTLCTDPAFPVCDLVRHECQSGGGTDGAMPPDLAVTMCTDSSTCPAGAPVCAAEVCGPCAGDSSTCAAFHAATPLCGPAGACVECLTKTECATKAATPFCGPANSCVQCLKASDCSPHVCGTDNSCRACQMHAECPSGVCGTDGNCVDPSMIALVDNGGMTIANCNTSRSVKNGQTPATAYCDISDAISKPYVLVTGHGATFPYTPLTIGSSVALIGPGRSAAMPAVIAGTTAQTAIVKLTNVSVTIDGFEITSGNTKNGVDCTGPATPKVSLTVRRSYVHDNNSEGVSTTNCDLTVEDSRISTSSIHNIIDASTVSVNITLSRTQIDSAAADGMNLYGNVTIDRCVIANNLNGNGLQLNGPNFKITNSFFFLNGKGIELNTTSTAATGIFQFNTVAKNDVGIACYGKNTVQTSIVWGNQDENPDGGFNSAQSGCLVLGVATDNNPTPAFVDISSPATYDFHLATDTPGHIAANQACCIDKVTGAPDGGTALSDHDYDGTMRPKGAAWDVGAHEAK